MAVDKMKVFVSWSGKQAQRVAEVWCNLLTDSFDIVQPFMSEQNIGAGERGLPKIAEELEGTKFGIIVVTPENQKSQWLNYEAGALSKGISDPTVRVAPSLVGFERASDVTGPIGQFQATLLDLKGVERILVEVAKTAGADVGPIPGRLQRCWGEYEQRFAEASRMPEQHPAPRSQPELLDEILTIVRDLRQTSSHSPVPEQYRVHLPLDVPVEEIRAVINDALGPDHAYPVTLSVGQEGRVIVEIHLAEPEKMTQELLHKLGTPLMALPYVETVVFPYIVGRDASGRRISRSPECPAPYSSPIPIRLPD